jgi:hypothetical protein
MASVPTLRVIPGDRGALEANTAAVRRFLGVCAEEAIELTAFVEGRIHIAHARSAEEHIRLLREGDKIRGCNGIYQLVNGPMDPSLLYRYEPGQWQRLNLIERFLLDLGLKHDRNGDQITLQDEPRGWRVFAATVASVSGFRCFGATGDELCKWKSADKMANPAGEVMASINAMTVTHPGARRLLVSSPLGMTDHHYKRFELGDTGDQLTCEAPTWVANPSVTEQQTRELEPDERIWNREYRARPQAGALSVFEPEAIVRAFQWPSPMGEPVGRVGIIDASSGRKDSWTWGVCGWRSVGAKKALVFDKVEAFAGNFWAQKSGEEIVLTIAEALKAQGIRHVFGDQRESYMISAAFRRHSVTFQEMTWSAPSKERAVGTTRRWLADGMLYLPEHERLKDELLEFEERTTNAGGFTFAARGTGHDDFVALLLTAAMADAEKKIPGSPSRRISMVEALNQWAGREKQAKADGWTLSK